MSVKQEPQKLIIYDSTIEGEIAQRLQRKLITLKELLERKESWKELIESGKTKNIPIGKLIEEQEEDESHPNNHRSRGSQKVSSKEQKQQKD